MFAKDTEITHALVIKKLNEIVSARGKKGTNRKEQIELLRELRTIADQHNLGPAMDMKVLFNITAAIYDYNPNVATCMKPDMWAKYVFILYSRFFKTIIILFYSANTMIQINTNILPDGLGETKAE